VPNTTLYVAVTAYDAQGNESDFSNEVTYKVPNKQRKITIKVLTSSNLFSAWILDTNYPIVTVTNIMTNKFLKFDIVEEIN